jgi:hypothetical protein
VRHDHPELRRDHVEALGSLLADHMHRRPAPGAMGVVGLGRHVHARQIAGKRAAIGAALLGALARPRRVLLVVVGFGRRNGLLDILERQIELIRVELLRAPAKLRPLQLVQEMPQALILRQGLIALHDRGVTLRKRRRKPRLQHFDIGPKLRVRSRSRVTANQIRAPSWRTICSLIQLVTVLTKSRSDAARR